MSSSDVSELTKLPEPASWVPSEITKEVLVVSGCEVGFVLRGVLSRAECAHFISFLDASDTGAATPSAKYRNSHRITTSSPEVSRVVFDRVRPFLANSIEVTPETKSVHHDFNGATLGHWEPYELNQAFRVCKYDAGGHFAPHYDGERVISSKNKSLQTFMIYLNEGFEGGATHFLRDDTAMGTDAEGRIAAGADDVLLAVRPEPGLALIFNHRIMHEGQALRSNDVPKYMMRTEIMFHQTVSTGSASLGPKDEQALRLVMEADILESNGSTVAAAECWRKAFKLSPALAAHYSS